MSGSYKKVGQLDSQRSNFGQPNSNMEEYGGLIDLWLILRIFQRWGWLIALITILFPAIMAIFLHRATPIYRATSLLEVKQEERNVIDVSEVDKVIVDQEFLTTQIELLKSESLIEDTIETLNLLSDSYLAPLDDEAWVVLPRDERLRSLVVTFKNSLRVAPVGRSRLIKVSFEHSDPQKAAQISNILTENYISNGLSRKLNATAFARKFLEDRLKSVRSSLDKAERDLVKYATDNDIIIMDGDNGKISSGGSLDKTALKTIDAELTLASIARVEAEIIYQQSSQETLGAEVLNNTALSDLKAKLLELNSEYQEKLAIFKPAYPEMIELKARINMFEKEIVLQEEAITSSSNRSFKNAYDLAFAKEQDLLNRFNNLKKSVVDIREKSINYNIIERQVETERTQYEALLQRLKEVSVSDDLGSNLVEVVDEAKPPRDPFKPNRLRTLLLTILLSGALGFGLAYVIEFIDDRIKTPDDVKNKLKQIIMGVIPISNTPDNLIVDLENSQATLAEAYASLRTNLQFSSADGGPQIIQLTSTRSGEGKSVSALGISLRYAGIGKSVLLIDADMRRPTFLQGGKPSIGLSGLMTQRVEFGEEIQVTRYPGLHLLPSGVIVPNPSELLASERFDDLLEWAKSNYEYVIIDSPPVLGLADAPLLGAKVEATLLIVDAGILRTPNIKASIERLHNSGTNILGVVLTKYKAPTKGYMDYYQYTYGNKANNYSNASEDKKSKRSFSLK